MALLLQLINFLMKTVISSMIGSFFNTRSKQTSFAIIAVFIVQFCNTVLILVVTDTSLFKQNQVLQFFIDATTNGQTDDYNISWFEVDGKLLVKLMFLTAMQPMLEATITVPFFTLLRMIDRNLSRVRSSTLTAMPTVDAYIELHAGPQFVLDYRIAALLL